MAKIIIILALVDAILISLLVIATLIYLLYIVWDKMFNR